MQAVGLFLALLLLWTAPAIAQIANSFPGDVNIESHPDVLLVERFQDSVAGVTSRLNGVTQNTAGMLLVVDSPPGSPLPNSLRMTSIGGTNTGGYIYKDMSPICATLCDEFYFRVYVKWANIGTYHHTGPWIIGQTSGFGFLPSTCCTLPLGNERFYIGVEPSSGPGGPNAFGPYVGWMNMRGSGIFDPVNCSSATNECFFGNAFEPRSSISFGSWHSIETYVGMNTPVSGSSGRLKVWVDGLLILDLSQGVPLGSWNGNVWQTGVGSTPFDGFRWRSSLTLAVAAIWLNYYTTGNATGVNGNVQWAHLVAARSRIGPLATSSVPGRPTNVQVTSITPFLGLGLLAAMVVLRRRRIR